MKLNKTQVKTLNSAVKHGFTFKNDSHFASYRAGHAAISALVKHGFLVEKSNEFGKQYEPTEKALDFVKYGIL